MVRLGQLGPARTVRSSGGQVRSGGVPCTGSGPAGESTAIRREEVRRDAVGADRARRWSTAP